jgi:hypothetical protein
MRKKGKPSGARLGLQIRLSCSSFPIARYGKSQNYFTGAIEKPGANPAFLLYDDLLSLQLRANPNQPHRRPAKGAE